MDENDGGWEWGAVGTRLVGVCPLLRVPPTAGTPKSGRKWA